MTAALRPAAPPVSPFRAERDRTILALCLRWRISSAVAEGIIAERLSGVVSPDYGALYRICRDYDLTIEAEVATARQRAMEGVG